MVLNVVVIGAAVRAIVREPRGDRDWKAALFAQHGTR